MLDVKFVSKLVIINIGLLTLLSFGTAMSIVHPQRNEGHPSTIENETNKKPHTLLFSSTNKLKTNSSNIINVNCSQLEKGSITISKKVTASQVRIVSPNCLRKPFNETLTQVTNTTNKFSATIFSLNKDSISTDYIYLEKGVNILEIQQSTGKTQLLSKLIINKE